MRVPLDLPAGISSDDTTFASEGRWADGNNMRPRLGRMQTIGGWQRYFSDSVTGVCRNVIAWTTDSAGVNIAFGSHSKLAVYVSGGLSDITPAGLGAGSIDSSGAAPGWGTGTWGSGTWSVPSSTYYLRTWSLHTWGANLLATPRGGTLYQWQNDPGSPATAVANAPVEIMATLTTPERQVLAIGCTNSSGNFDPLCVRGCDIEGITSWTASATNNAFEDRLEGGGRLVTGRLIDPFVCLWSDNAVYRGQYLGNPTQPYRWNQIETNCGVAGPNAVVVYKGLAYWIGPDLQFRAWDMSGLPQIVPCPIRKDFTDNIDATQLAKIVAVANAQYDEIWFFYPDLRDGGAPAEDSRYLALCLSELDAFGSPTWYRGRLPRTAFIDSGVQQYPVGVDASGTVYRHEYGTSADGSALTATLASADQYLGEGDRVLMLREVWPDFENQQCDVAMTVRARNRPQESERSQSYALAVGSGKRSIRISGAIFRIELAASDANCFYRVGKPEFDAIPLGART